MTELNPDLRCCPFCGEEIKRIAVKCKHCHSDVAQLEHTESIETAVPQESNSHPTLAGVRLNSVQVPAQNRLKRMLGFVVFATAIKPRICPTKSEKTTPARSNLSARFPIRILQLQSDFCRSRNSPAYHSEVDRRKKEHWHCVLALLLARISGRTQILHR